MIVIKFQNGDDIRIVNVNHPLALKEINELVKSLFRGALPQPYALRYKDDEGDYITVESDREIEEAFRLFQDQAILRFFVVPAQNKALPTEPSPPATPSAPKIEKTNGQWLPQKLVNTVTQAFETGLEEATKFGEGLGEQFTELLPKIEETFTNAFRVEEPIHFAMCDQCNERIKGLRFKCSQCQDFDLCNKCKQSGAHSEHQFWTIRNPHTTESSIGAKPRRCSSAPPKSSGQDDVQIPLHVVAPQEVPQAEVKPAVPVKVEKAAEVKPAEPAKEKSEISPFESKLVLLEEMGFPDRQGNVKLLVKHTGDMVLVIKELLE